MNKVVVVGLDERLDDLLVELLADGGRDVPLPSPQHPRAAAGIPLVAVVDRDGNLIAVAESLQSRLVPRQVFA